MRVAVLASLLLIAASNFQPSGAEPTAGTTADWPYYGGDAGGTRYSPLTQIDRSNVGQLKTAWEYHTGDVSDGSHNRRKSEFETTPIVVNGMLYLTTPFNRVIALDPETGREKWSFDPKIDLHAGYSEGLVNRGVALWTDTEKGEAEPCRRRIFLATIDARLFALDAAAGQPCADFGAGGQIDLTLPASESTRKPPPRQLSMTWSSLVPRSQTTTGSTARAGRSEPSTRAPATSAGAGTRSPKASHQPAPATPGRRSRSTAERVSSLYRPPAQAPIIMVSSAQAITGGRIRSSH
jgi:glucose dehydrogenase